MKFRKKIVEIEAIQWSGNWNLKEITEWIDGAGGITEITSIDITAILTLKFVSFGSLISCTYLN